jgi:hypothetical protein
VADYDPADGLADEDVRELLWRYAPDNPAAAEDKEELPDAPPAADQDAAPQPAAPAAQNPAPVADAPQVAPVQGVGINFFSQKCTGKPRPGYTCRPLMVRYVDLSAGVIWYRDSLGQSRIRYRKFVGSWNR